MPRSRRRKIPIVFRAKPSVPVADQILATAFAILVALSIGRFPEGERWIWFAALVSLALVHGAWQLARGMSVRLDLADGLLALLIALGALSLIWSANRNGGIQTVIIASCALFLAVYLKSQSRTVLLGICVGVGLGDLYALSANLWLPPGLWSGFANRGYVAEVMIASLPFLWPIWKQGGIVSRAFVIVCGVSDIVYVTGWTPSLIPAFAIAVLLFIGSMWWAWRRT